jgi:hypothetical protein
VNYYCGGLPRTLGPVDRDKLVKVLGMLGSDHEGERAAAALKADRHLRGLGLQWDDIIARPGEAPEAPLTWQSMASAILASGRATRWEQNFCETLLRSWRGPHVTAKQRAALESIYASCRA